MVFAVSSVLPVSRFRLDIAPGERAGQGQRVGFVFFAAWVDVLVAPGEALDVAAGVPVHGCRSVIARFVRGPAAAP